ncbi:hormone-sensitive lipase [Chrysoperla carnea]|uniref:hormone-sensitive lipase n=1 Tax=Chrysoperla carnea TaxID=189513 RepID=UPI001D072C52|nr:hormone-sensitive lipase [Chrysoperla carnea]
MICNSISILRNDHFLFKQSFYRLSGGRLMTNKTNNGTDKEFQATMLNTAKDQGEGSPPPTSTSKQDEDKNITNDGDKKEQSDDIFVIIDILKDLSENNQKYFRADDTEFGQRIYESYVGIDCHLENLRPIIVEIQELAPKYDYDVNVPGNGYRSFLTVVYRGLQHTINVTKRIVLKRDQMLFRKSVYVKEIESCSHLLASLQQCLEYLRTLSKWSSVGELFPRENHTPYDLLSTQTHINQYCFYGRCLGFQFCEAMSNVLKVIILCMTSFSEIYFNRSNSLFSKATNSMWVSGRYILDPELRAKRVVNLSQNAPIDFCKSFWFLAESEIMQMIPKITPASSVIQVNKIISIPPEPLEYLNKTTKERIQIPIPQAHIGIKPIQVRLISACNREGMIGSSSEDPSTSTCSEASKSLIIHCHGGGFVAQSSRSHLVYLKEWAIQLNVPILSIDYSLAPEAPYPRAVQEILYAYVWALNNKNLLGTTAENIVFAGDSAGANLINVLAIKCIELNIQPPNGIFNAYVPVILNFKPTPARMLCLMDPLLPLGFMLRCIKSYTTYDSTSNISTPSESCGGGVNDGTARTQTNSFEQITTSDLLNAHKSQVILCTSDNDNVEISTISDDTIINDNDCDLLDDDNDSDWIKLDTSHEDHEQLTLIHEFDCNNQSLIQRATTYEQQQQQLNMIAPNKIKQRMTNLVNVITNTLNKWRTTTNTGPEASNTETATNTDALINDMDDNNVENVIKEFNINVPLDPYLSPYYASNDILKKLPPIRILTVELDPCLDDCVTYAKKLKELDCDVKLDILKGLPHGFLNFSLFSKEAQEGSKKCIDRIQELLNSNQSH